MSSRCWPTTSDRQPGRCRWRRLIRIITFEPGFGEESDRISVETFSPERFKNDEPAFKTGPWSEFGFDLDFAQRFALR